MNSKINIYYSTIKKIFNYINNYLNIHIIYPYNIEIQDIKYYLHSFIICNTSEDFDTHFVYYKTDIKNNSILRYDDLDLSKSSKKGFAFLSGDKKRIYHINKQNKYYDELSIIQDDKIIDNMKTKVCFVCYRKL